MSAAGSDNYADDFEVGDCFSHARGKTVTEMDNVLLTHLVMNTAQSHFNEHIMQDSQFGRRIVFGGVTAAIVIGLAAQDTAEHAQRELSMDNIQFLAPVFHGDTLYAFSEVLAKGRRTGDGQPVTFRHFGINQRDELVFQGDRTALLDLRRPPTDPIPAPTDGARHD